MSETLELEGLSFEVRRSTRRRTLGLTVDRGGELVMHAPPAANADELAAWARPRLVWVHRKLALKDEVARGAPIPEYVSGESFRWLGKNYRLALVDAQQPTLRFDGIRFLLRRDARPADDYFRQWYIAAGKEWLPRRIAWLQPRTGPAPARLVVRDLGYRWGSCGRDRTLYFNWRVFQFPTRLVDYVVVHELCHLVEPSHGPEFRRALGRALPDWEDRKAALDQGGADIYWCHPGMRQ